MKVRAERLDEESIRYVYKTYMKIDFPRSELKPLKSILSLIQRKRGEGYGFYDKDELTGYAFLIKAPSGRAYLIDYLAVLPSLRDRGYGSACLSALQNILEEKNTLHSKLLGTGENMESTANEREYMIMVESEDPSFAADETEKQVRRRRISVFMKRMDFLIPKMSAASSEWSTEYSGKTSLHDAGRAQETCAAGKNWTAFTVPLFQSLYITAR